MSDHEIPNAPEQLAQMIAEQLREQHARARGVIVNGKKEAGVVFVTAKRNADEPTLLATGAEPEEEIREKVAAEFASGGLPIGFIRWQSEPADSEHEVTVSSQAFPASEHLGLWAKEMLNRAGALVRSYWRPN